MKIKKIENGDFVEVEPENLKEGDVFILSSSDVEGITTKQYGLALSNPVLSDEGIWGVKCEIVTIKK